VIPKRCDRQSGGLGACCCLYVVTERNRTSRLREPFIDAAWFHLHEVTKVTHYRLEVNAMIRPTQVGEDETAYGERKFRE
jgi:hypothetical protein